MLFAYIAIALEVAKTDSLKLRKEKKKSNLPPDFFPDFTESQGQVLVSFLVFIGSLLQYEMFFT